MNTCLTVNEVAEKFQLSTRQIKRLMYSRKIPYIKIGSAVRFDPEDLREWMEKRKLRPLGVKAGRVAQA
jgi:excisionase family DNA binding protein